MDDGHHRIAPLMRLLLLVVAIALSACGTPVKTEPGTTSLRLKHGVSISIPQQFAFNARLADGKTATNKQPDVPVDPVLPQLAALRNLQREAMPIRPGDESTLLTTEYEDGGIRYDIHVNVAWLDKKHDLEDMNAIVASKDRLDAVAAHHEKTARTRKDDYFSDNIAITGWKLEGTYPVIDYEFHSKLRHLGNFDTDYIYNRTLTIGRKDGTIIILIDMPESRRAAWKARVDAMVKSLAFAQD
jgi:hypothetical protein